MILRLLVLLIIVLPARASLETFYLGTDTVHSASRGIYAGTFDTDTGKIGPLKLVAEAKNPTFLTLSGDRRHLFAALDDAVASFQVQAGGSLAPINRQPSGGPNTCHVSLDQTGHQLFSASYDAGSIAAFPVDDGGHIGERTTLISLSGSGPNHERQEGPHAHSVNTDPENHFLYTCDLGSDRIWIFRLGDHGRLVPANPPFAKVAPGTGPRHLTFSPDGTLVYVANELAVTTSVFARDAATGALTALDTLDNIAPGWPKGTGSAEIVVHPTGRWAYVSTRLQDFMTVFNINAHQMLLPEQITPSPVKFPRSFAIDPTGRWLVVAGQTDNRISVMKIDPANGHVTPTGDFQSVGAPVCVAFASASLR